MTKPKHSDFDAKYAPTPPYSFSQLSLFDECPRKYWVRYVAGIEEEPSVALEVGSALHEAIERGMGYLLKDKPKVLNPVEWYNKANEQPPQKPELTDFYNRTLGTFSEWLTPSLWQDWLDSDIEVGSEWSFGLSEDWKPVPWNGERESKPEGMLFRGAIDLMLLNHTSMYGNVIDFKTGKNRYLVLNKEELLPHRQLAVYAWAMFCHYPHLKFVTTSFFNLLLAKTPEISIVFNKEQAAYYGRDWIASTSKAIRSLDHTKVEEWIPKKNEHCDFCEIKDSCPLYQRFAPAKKLEPRLVRFNEFNFMEAAKDYAVDTEE